MIAQTDNKIISSFMLWLDHTILSKGQAYTNYSGSFYNIPSQYSNYYTYGAPFSQFVSDVSINGANVISGVYYNNVLVQSGTSGVIDINYNQGQIYLNSLTNYPISGYFAIKDFNISLTNDPEEVILFKTAYQLRPKYPQKATGITNDIVTYPIIFVRNEGSDSKPYSFGGTDQHNFEIRCVVLSDSLFKLHAVQSILRESVRTPIALFNLNEQPYNVRGGLKSGIYNYTGLASQKINSQQFMYVDKVTVPRSSQRLLISEKQLNPDIFFNYIDFECSIVGDFRC